MIQVRLVVVVSCKEDVKIFRKVCFRLLVVVPLNVDLRRCIFLNYLGCGQV
jgi:hypothetical protein